MQNRQHSQSISKIIFVTVVVFFLCSTLSTFGQSSGRIKGYITDKTSGEPLPSANIILEGTSLGAAATFDGDYIIINIPPGVYNAKVTYIGYKTQIFEVEIKADETVEKDIELEYVAIESEELVVTAQAVGQIDAINKQLSSNTIKNVVSAARIQDIPDANAAESVSRLPGISIIRSGGEGQKVAIRGLSPKYNVTMVNGVRMQSTDRDDRSVDLNMISPNILSGIEVTKALTADMDADAVGGTVNLKIGKAPTGYHSKVSAQGGYGSVADNYQNYKIAGLFSGRFLDNKLGVQVSASIDNYNRNSDVLSASYSVNEEAEDDAGLAELDLKTINIVDKVTKRKRISGGLVLDYQFNNGSLLLNNFISNLDEDQTIQSNTATVLGQKINGYLGQTELSNTVISNALQGEFELYDIKMDFSISNSISKQYRPGDLYLDYGPESGQVSYSTDLTSSATPSAYWNGMNVVNDVLRVNYLHSDKRDIVEMAQAAVLNFEIPYNFGNYVSGNLKVGGKYTHTDRDNDETVNYMQPISYNPGEEFTAFMRDSVWTTLGLDYTDYELGPRASLFEDANYDIGDFLSGEEGISDFVYLGSTSKMNHYEYLCRKYNSFWISGQGEYEHDFNYKRNLGAFYLATEMHIGKYITFFPGVRYEKFTFDYTAYGTNRFGPNHEDFNTKDVSSETGDENWFPQMQLRIKPTDWLDIRLAGTKSIIYPDYRAVSPFYFYDTYTGEGASPGLILGNPELKPASSHNLDLYASVYDNYIGLFTAGLFYKEIDDLIVLYTYKSKDASTINNRVTLVSGQNSQITTWINLDAISYVRGFELDWQTHFWYLPSFLQGLVFSINYTHINTDTQYPFQVLVKEGSGPFAKSTLVDSSRAGRMPDQPNDVLNATLGYDFADFSARLSFVYQDNVLTNVSSRAELDSYTDASYRWDFTAYQKLPWHGLQLFLNINNITNEPDRQFVSIYEKLSSVEYYGRSADLGLRYEF